MMRKQMEALVEEMLNGKILLAEAVGEFEKIYIERALERNGDHLMKTAEALGIHRNTLANRLASYEAAKPSKIFASKSRKRGSATAQQKPQVKKMKARAAGAR